MIEAAWLVFIVASLLLIVTPGQDMILVMSRSLAQGAAAGLATAYHVYPGIGLLRTRQHPTAPPGLAQRPLGRLFVEGALSNLSNPKIAVFYFAFLPQFVSPSAQHPALSILVLGLVFALLTFLVKGPVGLFAAALSGWLRSRPKVLPWVYRSSGAILIGLGVRLAFERRE